MQPTKPNTISELWEAAVERLPYFSPTEQEVGLVLLTELARGEPVSPARLGRTLGIDQEDVAACLHDSALSFAVHSNEEGSIQGFFGLSTVPTDHRFDVNGHTLWTWCAADTLFLPKLLDATASVESKDPDTAVVSMNSPQTWETTSAVRLINTACHYIHFFASQESGRKWTAGHTDPVLISVGAALRYGSRQNQRMFGGRPGRTKGSHPMTRIPLQYFEGAPTGRPPTGSCRPWGRKAGTLRWKTS